MVYQHYVVWFKIRMDDTNSLQGVEGRQQLQGQRKTCGQLKIMLTRVLAEQQTFFNIFFSVYKSTQLSFCVNAQVLTKQLSTQYIPMT